MRLKSINKKCYLMPPSKRRRFSTSEYKIHLLNQEPFQIKLHDNLKIDDFCSLMRTLYPDYVFCRPKGITLEDELESIKDLTLKFLKADGFQIFVKGLDGSMGTFYLTENGTALSIKEQIEFKWELPVDKQRLVFGGKQLDDELIPHKMEPSVNRESTLHLILKLRGD
jgi:large subunit ribosomal protein L40e